MGATKKTKARKGELWAELQDACAKYNKALFVNTDNVTSKQISVMRKGFRAIDAVMICGKNTMMKASITALNTAPAEDDEDYEERNATWEARPHLEKIIGQLKGNTSIIFTNTDLLEVRAILDSQVREAPARVGSLAPKDVIIKQGPTGLDPKETNFFQKLSIATKIMKAKIEIINDVMVIKEGDKITASQSALLDKLKMRPFEYKMSVKTIMQDGNMFDPKVLDITSEDVLAIFSKGVSNMTALSLGSGYVTPMSAPHLIMHSFKNLAAIAFATDYSFAQADALKAAASAAKATVVVAAKVETKEAVKEEVVEEEKEEENFDMGGMFGDEEEY